MNSQLIMFRDAKIGFGDRAAIASRDLMVPGECCFVIKSLKVKSITMLLLNFEC